MGEIFLPPKLGHRLTEVSLISTHYGKDRDIKVLGYIAEEPYVIFVELFSSYFVSGYYEELYPLYNTSLKHTLFIRDYGNRYEPFNFSKPQFHDISSFKNLAHDLKLAEIINDPSDNKASEKTLADAKEYMDTLAIIKNNNPVVQKAIDQVELLEIYKIHDEDTDYNNKVEFLKNRISMIEKHITDDYETMALLNYIMKMIIDVVYN